MKLISKFHDYYDGALAQGRDELVLYVRQRGSVGDHLSKDITPWLVEGRYGRMAGAAMCSVRDQAQPHQRHHVPYYGYREDESKSSWSFEEAFVVVAGQAYPIWLRPGRDQELLGHQAMTLHGPLGTPSIEAAAQEMENLVKASPEFAKEPQIRVVPGQRFAEEDRRYAQARERFLAADFTELHLRHGAPVLLLASPDTLRSRHTQQKETQTDEALRSNVRIITNPRLADLNFASVLDPFTCFQALSQFIGGVVPGQQMPMVEISDKSKIQKKGFDPKYGFRTRPSSA